MPQVLVVDDDSSVRTLLRRLLIAEFDAEVHEAQDGLQALEQLARLNTSLVLLDLTMPVMNGIETLEVIRRSERLSSLPIAVMTATRDEAIVRRVIRLGVADFLLKPLKRTIAIERLSRLLEAKVTPISGRPARLLDLSPGAELLIVDGSPEFRAFFRQHLESRYAIREARDGVAALRHCLTSPPDAVFMATELDLLDADMLARKLRSDPRFRSLALVAVTPQPGTVPSRNIYDGVMARTFVTETFDASFCKLLATGEQPPLLAEGSPIVKQIALAAFQVCHMLLKTDVTLDEDSGVLDATSRRWCIAAVEVHTRDGAVDLQVLASHDSAAALTGRRLDMEPRLLGEQDLLATLGDIGGTLAETLSQTLTRRGVPSGCAAPRLEVISSVGLPPVTSEHEQIQFTLTAREDGSQLVVRLERLTAEHSVAAEPKRDRSEVV